MWVQKCDICGEEQELKRFRYKVKVEQGIFCWEGHFWQKVDICDDCQEAMVEFIKQWKEDERIKREKTDAEIH